MTYPASEDVRAMRARNGSTLANWLLGLLSAAVIALAGKTITDGERVAKVEQQTQHLDQSLNRIEGKLDQLLSRDQLRR